jgi:hypothetical protein
MTTMRTQRHRGPPGITELLCFCNSPRTVAAHRPEDVTFACSSDRTKSPARNGRTISVTLRS